MTQKTPFPRRLRPCVAALFVGALALFVVTGTAANMVLMTVIGCIGAAIVSTAVTVEYLVLVPLKENPGAKRLVGLLVAIDLLLGATILRYFVRDFPFRNEVQAWLFWALLFAIAYLGWHIWRDQVQGARQFRDQRRRQAPEQEETP